ncbi:hypothetical protein GCM10025791_27990 [Halioxenophilus aromaticivorans]|uniref:Uncharacterized protein n=1 Tax=Halioxenophilus aromaticivorans TaxID=1306992 RepID=A0AAV3U3V2_9ALTE
MASYTTPSGQEVFANGDTCSKIVAASDDHDQEQWQIGARCAWIQSDSEKFMDKVNQGLQER